MKQADGTIWQQDGTTNKEYTETDVQMQNVAD